MMNINLATVNSCKLEACSDSKFCSKLYITLCSMLACKLNTWTVTTHSSNTTSRQTTAVMAMTADVDKLFSRSAIKSRKYKVLHLCIGLEGQGSTFHHLHTAMSFSLLIKPQFDTGRISLSPLWFYRMAPQSLHW